jgi:hypothetical protein
MRIVASYGHKRVIRTVPENAQITAPLRPSSCPMLEVLPHNMWLHTASSVYLYEDAMLPRELLNCSCCVLKRVRIEWDRQNVAVLRSLNQNEPKRNNMSTMNMPGFTAGTSLYKTIRHYRSGRGAINSPMEMIVPAIPLCRNCDRLIDLCLRNSWRPRAACNACLFGDCEEDPPTA